MDNLMQVIQPPRALSLPPSADLFLTLGRQYCNFCLCCWHPVLPTLTSFEQFSISPSPSYTSKRIFAFMQPLFSQESLYTVMFLSWFQYLGSWHPKIQKIRHSIFFSTATALFHYALCPGLPPISFKHPRIFNILLAKGMLLMNERNILAQGNQVTGKCCCFYPSIAAVKQAALVPSLQMQQYWCRNIKEKINNLFWKFICSSTSVD